MSNNAEKVADDVKWSVAKTYVWYRYRRLILVATFGLTALTVGAVYYLYKRRQRRRKEKEAKNRLLGTSDSASFRDLDTWRSDTAINTPPPSSPHSTYAKTSLKEAEDYDSEISVSLTRPPMRISPTLDEILRDAPETRRQVEPSSQSGKQAKARRSSSRTRSKKSSKASKSQKPKKSKKESKRSKKSKKSG
ncbi:hypothetical protein Q1695_008265 [Nippostrongylus brasiliensis]|nr:hypothetical protein Q1695_008265 [Nippostrongylus brasiliensis]